jgi:hypothetical protein
MTTLLGLNSRYGGREIRARPYRGIRHLLSESPGVTVSIGTVLLSRGNLRRSLKPFIINSLELYLPTHGVLPQLEIPSAFLHHIMVSERVSRRWNRGEISAKPSARSRVKRIRELAQLGF